MNSDPRWYGLPHSSFRPSQFDAIVKTIDVHKSGGGTIFIDSPVGTGKSGIACALGAYDKVTVLTSTLELLAQYERIYGFTAIRGRQYYPCVYQKRIDRWNKPGKPTAFDCYLPKMKDCPVADKCPYLNAKYAALSARRSVATYKYGSLSKAFAERDGFLVFDECDTSVREITSHAEMKITLEECKYWKFPAYPQVTSGVLEDRETIIDWLCQCEAALPEYDGDNIFEMELAAEVEKKRSKLSKTIEALETGDWFIDLSEDGTLVLKPLTACDLAQIAYTNKQTIVLMSATIGNPKALAHQLGILSFEHVEYPHPTPTSARPVYAIAGSPKMSYTPDGTRDPKYIVQGILVWKFIQGNIDPDWRGIVLTSSRAKADKLTEILKDRLPNRKIITGGSSDLIAAFKSDNRKGLIAVGYTQGWSHGVDLVGDLGRFSIIASVPYPSDTDPYVRALRMYDKAFYEYNTFSAIPQGIGRVTRGEIDSQGNWLLNIGALADARAWDNRAIAYYPKWFTESIVRN